MSALACSPEAPLAYVRYAPLGPEHPDYVEPWDAACLDGPNAIRTVTQQRGRGGVIEVWLIQPLSTEDGLA